MRYPSKVKLVDVGPRDGLQNEKEPVPAAVKIALVHRLQDAGLKEIEVTSFVSPKWVPQMADAAEVMAGIQRKPGRALLGADAQHEGPGGRAAFQAGRDRGLRGGQRGLQPAQHQLLHCRKHRALRAGGGGGAGQGHLRARRGLSVAVGCPYEGEIAPARVEMVARLMKEIGVQHLGVADTIGVGTPRKVQAAMEAALKHYALDDISGHFHDTYGQALPNTLACLEMGIWQYDSSVAGLGGCPYAKGATGNVATEDVVYMLHGMGIDTGIDLDKLIDAGKYISDFLGRKPQLARRRRRS
jgi:hydroxymethylglutaryl-CoA lyase